MGRWSKEEAVWRSLSSEIGGDLLVREHPDGVGVWADMRLVTKVGRWSITLHLEESGGYHLYWSRTRHLGLTAPYVSKDGFQFQLHRKRRWPGLLAGLSGGRTGGAELPELQRGLVLKSNDEQKIKALLDKPTVRHLVVRLNAVLRVVRHADAVHVLGCTWPGRFSADAERLRTGFQLVGTTLDHLAYIGSASNDEPDTGRVPTSLRGRLWP